MRRTGTAAAVIFVMAAVTLACGTLQHPATKTLSVEGQMAVAGRQVIAAVSSAADGTDKLIDSGVLPKDQGVAVLQALRVVGVESGRLADALSVIDQARDATARTSGIRTAAELVRSLQKAVTMAIVPVGSEAGRGRVAALLAVIADALVSVSLILPKDIKDPLITWNFQPAKVAFAT